MQVEIITPSLVFPCLGVARQTPDLIVLFSDESKGTVLTPVANSFGLYREDWNMEDFDLYHGQLVLSN